MKRYPMADIVYLSVFCYRIGQDLFNTVMPIVSLCIWSALSTVAWFVYRPHKQYSLCLAVDR